MFKSLSFFISTGGELLYNFLYLVGCLLVLTMLSSEWQRTHEKEYLYLVNAFAIMFVNLIYTNISLAHEVFLGIIRSNFWFPIINWNLETITLIFITWAFLYPIVGEKIWLKKYLTYNILILLFSFSIITPIWLNNYFLVQDFRHFWAGYYYNLWEMGLLTLTISYLHVRHSDYPNPIIRFFLGVLLFRQFLNLSLQLSPYQEANYYVLHLERGLPLIASFSLVISIYKDIVSSLVSANNQLQLVQKELSLSHQKLEYKVEERTRELLDKNIELLRFKELHENVLASLTNGILVLDNHFRIIAANLATEHHLGLPVSSLLGQTYRRLLPAGEEWNWEEIFREIISTGRDIRIKLVHYLLPHLPEEVVINIQGQPLKDKEEQNIGLILTLEFITEQVKLKERIKRSERLAYLGQIAAGMAHEIRNPLNSISINLQLLTRSFRSSNKNRLNPIETLGIIGDEVGRLEGIVHEFIQYARPPRMHLRPQSLNRILEQTIGVLAPQIAMTKIRLSKKFDPQIPPLLLDMDQLKQVFLNIGLNSIQVMPNGGELHFTSRLCFDNGSPAWAQVSITDTGHGIPLEKQGRVFEPFYSSKENGLGLGLAIAHRIVEEHRGQILLSSQVTQGTTFTIKFPVDEAAIA